MPSGEDALLVSFRRFYPGFDPRSFWLPLLSKVMQREVQISPQRKADVVISSVFESRREMWKRRVLTRISSPQPPQHPQRMWQEQKLIWVTGENVRPPAKGFDMTISFDLDPYGGSNTYFPLIYQELDWSDCGVSRTAESINPRTGLRRMNASRCMEGRQGSVGGRPGFVCAFVGNSEPVRMRAIDELRRFGRVDVFGTAVGKPVSSKMEVASNYRFMLCFENDLYPGYVTEKPLEAYECGCVPLWRGTDYGEILNPDALINAAEFPTLVEFAAHVANVDAQSSAMERLSQGPLFSRTPTLEPLVEGLERLLKT